jgi:sugar phosphate isomerase/epimerase
MKLNQVALQLYCVRDYATTRADVARTFKRIKQIGYDAVQVNSIVEMPEDELNRMLADEGLVCCATHEPSEMIREHPERVVERLKKLNCSYTAYGWPAGVDWSKKKDVESLVADLDKAGAVLKKAGQVLTYHNHSLEFVRFEGATALDYIYSHTDPTNLQGELDTYWVQNGGCDPVFWCRKLKGRLPLLHIKDYAVLPDGTPTYTSIGSGNLDWPAIIDVAEKSGCKWFIVEQDTAPGDIFEAIKKSYDYIKANLIER